MYSTATVVYSKSHRAARVTKIRASTKVWAKSQFRQELLTALRGEGSALVAIPHKFTILYVEMAKIGRKSGQTIEIL